MSYKRINSQRCFAFAQHDRFLERRSAAVAIAPAAAVRARLAFPAVARAVASPARARSRRRLVALRARGAVARFLRREDQPSARMLVVAPVPVQVFPDAVRDA